MSIRTILSTRAPSISLACPASLPPSLGETFEAGMASACLCMAVTDWRAKDTEIFFLSMLGAALTLLAGGVLFETVVAGGEAGGNATVLARIASIRSVRAMYAWFVLLPVGLAFLGIGVPFALKTLLRAVQRTLSRGEGAVLIGLFGSVALLLAPIDVWWRVPLALVAITGFGLVGARPGVVVLAHRVGRFCLLVAGAALIALAALEYRYLSSGTESVILASTAAVAVGFFLIPGLVLATTASLVGCKRRFSSGSAVLATILWYAWPWIRPLEILGSTVDWKETIVTAVCGVVAMVAGARITQG